MYSCILHGYFTVGIIHNWFSLEYHICIKKISGQLYFEIICDTIFDVKLTLYTFSD